MPLKLKISEKHNTTLLVWDLTEDVNYLASALRLLDDDIYKLQSLSPKRKKEWLSTRYLLKLVIPDLDLNKLTKDEYGKPYINGSDVFISISHSHDYAAVIVSDKVVGIDIQKIHDNIERISHKFISDKELSYTQNEDKILHMHINWGAKESMYKGYGKKELGFIRHLSIEPYQLSPGTTKFFGTVSKNEVLEHYELFTTTLNDFVLVYAIQT